MNIHKLKSGSYTAEINLSRGANCIRLRENVHQATILREPDYETGIDNPFLYGMPILFPVNRISGGRFIYEGREYIFPINEPRTGCHLHGFLHEKKFQLIEGGVDYAICSYCTDTEEEYFGGVHPFEIRIIYRLSGEGLEQQVIVKNLSSMNMPILLGFHTTFSIPFMKGQENENMRILAEVSDYVERDEINCLPRMLHVDEDEMTALLKSGEFVPCGTKISRHYKIFGKGRMEIRDATSGVCVYYENDSNYQFRMFYNGDANDYICLEPQTCMVNCVNNTFGMENGGFQYLNPGEEKVYVSKIGITNFR